MNADLKKNKGCCAFVFNFNKIFNLYCLCPNRVKNNFIKRKTSN